MVEECNKTYTYSKRAMLLGAMDVQSLINKIQMREKILSTLYVPTNVIGSEISRGSAYTRRIYTCAEKECSTLHRFFHFFQLD